MNHITTQDIAREEEAVKLFRKLITDNRDALDPIARWGDGEGGYMLSVIQEVFGITRLPATPGFRKKKISQSLRTKVFERDQYRCVYCESHLDLCADHIIAESKGGKTTAGNLQTLCRSCNSIKGAA